MCFLEGLNINQDVYQDIKNVNRQYVRIIRIQILDDILDNCLLRKSFCSYRMLVDTSSSSPTVCGKLL